MDHYHELLMAHIINGGGRMYADSVELEALRSAAQKLHQPFQPSDVPDDAYMWLPIASDSGRIVWESNAACDACEGTGSIAARGANGRFYDCCCPQCDGEGQITKERRTIVTDSDGVFIYER